MAGAVESAAEKLYRIGEVSRLTGTREFVLRYWETEFPMLKPLKAAGGHRRYRPQDVDMVLEIRRLLYEEGFTIAGARKHLRENGSRPERGGADASRARGPERGTTNLRALRDELRAILTLLEGQ